MNKLLYAGLGLGLAYVLFGGNSGGNAPVPPVAPDGSSANNFAPATPQITANTQSGNLSLNTTPKNYGSTALALSNIGAATYGNCQCKDGTMCVGKGNCACCSTKRGPVHTVILPVLKTTSTSRLGYVYGSKTCMG